jgi:phage major head subunit gpT-like protein
MDINYHNLQILRTGIDTRFKRTFDAAAKEQYGEFTTTIPMSTEAVTMPFLEQLTGMREWIDDRVINNLRADRLSVTPRKFELTYGIPRDAIEDDTYGIYVSLVDQMATQAANLRPDLIEALLNAAADKYWVDGKKFFAADRKYGKNTINNYSTNALTKANLKTAYDLMTGYKGHGGTPLRTRPTLLVHGPALRWTAKKLLDNPMEEVSGAALPNETYNLVGHLEVAGLEGNKWFLFATGGGYAMPVGYFERVRPDHVVREDQEKDGIVFMQDQYLYGCRGRAEAAFLMPHCAYFGNAA